MATKRTISWPLRVLLIIFCATLITVAVYVVFVQDEVGAFKVVESDVVVEYLVDTPGCKIPKYDPWDPVVKSYYQFSDNYRCDGPPSLLSVGPNAVVDLDDAILRLYYELTPKDVACTYRAIYRSGSAENNNIDDDFSLGPVKQLSFGVPLGEEFIRTECDVSQADGGRKKYTEYLPLTPLKPSVESHCSSASKNGRKKKGQKPNVLLLGIDSISRLNFIRHFPKTNAFLNRHLSPYSLKGYNKVGDNTFPNLVPLLTGHSYKKYANYNVKSHKFFDELEFVWKKFAEVGYRTLLAEDAPRIATFNYLRNGFIFPPTDYYYRPFALATEHSDQRKDQCLGAKMEMRVVYDYLRTFVQTMNGTRPYFAFVFLARLTHDVLNNAGYADDPTYQLLSYLHQYKFLENTVVIFFSDHGIRYSSFRRTYLGQFEERRPFFHLMLPRWFGEKHPKLSQNLRKNEERLTTPYDIHETLLELLNLNSDGTTKEESDFRGRNGSTSLFHEISPHRTCEDAGISSHWCTCQVQKPVAMDDDAVIKATAAVVRTVNELTRPFRNKCHPLKLKKIHDARANQRTSATNSSTAGSVSYLEYFIVISVTPGAALLEATVRCDTDDDLCVVVDEISRINRYGSQSDCVSDFIMKKYCYCKRGFME